MYEWLAIVSMCLDDAACWNVVADFQSESQCIEFVNEETNNLLSKMPGPAPQTPFIFGCWSAENPTGGFQLVDARGVRDHVFAHLVR